MLFLPLVLSNSEPKLYVFSKSCDRKGLAMIILPTVIYKHLVDVKTSKRYIQIQKESLQENGIFLQHRTK